MKLLLAISTFGVIYDEFLSFEFQNTNILAIFFKTQLSTHEFHK